MQRPFFALLTDFGLQDPYVGQVKSVLFSRLPEACVFDLTHGVRSHDIMQGAFFLASSWAYLPARCVVLAIVDPGVGSKRGIVLLQHGLRMVLAPDNGLLTLLMDKLPRARFWRLKAERDGCPEENIFSCPEVSTTFHGRDLFAPLAVRLVLSGTGESGFRPDDAGFGPLDRGDLVHLDIASPVLDMLQLEAAVLQVDHFGNVVLNLPAAEYWSFLAEKKRLLLTVLDQDVNALPVDRDSRASGDGSAVSRIPVRPVSAYFLLAPNEVGLVPGSQGYLELALNQASCAGYLGLFPGKRCVLSWFRP